jgi:hypothetical protein
MTEHHDRETVVVERDRGSGLGTILGIIIVVALLAAVWYFTLGPGGGGANNGGGGGGSSAQPTLEAPSDVVPSDEPAAS